MGKLLSAAAPALSQPGALRRYLLPRVRGSSILQYVSISNQHVDILNYTMLYVNYISIKLRKIKIKAEKKNFSHIHKDIDAKTGEQPVPSI